MKNRILIIGPKSPPMGGIAEYIKNLMKSDLNRKYNFKLLNTYKIKGKSTSSHFSIRNFMNFILNVFDLIINITFDRPILIHIHTSSYWGFWEKSLYLLIAKIMGEKVIFHIHGGGFGEFYSNLNTIMKKIISFILKRSDTNVLLSNCWYNYFLKIAPDGKFKILPNYTDMRYIQAKEIEKFYKKHIQLENKFIVLFIGTLSKEKGLEDIIEIIKRMKKFKGIIFVVCGEGALKGKLEVLEQETTNLVFWGKINEPARSRLYSISEIFILPSYYEGFPMVLLEAMSFRNAVITTSVGGIPDLVKDGYNGIIVTPGRIDSLYRNLLSLYKDSNLLKKFQNNAFKTIKEEYNWKKGCIEVDKLYQEVICG